MATTATPRKQKGHSPAPPVRAAAHHQVTVPQAQPVQKQKPSKKKKSYASEGVKDHDIFLLPVSDYQLMGLLTLLATAVRLFRIYQPTSVVFDEVQYVPLLVRLVVNWIY